VGLISNSVLNLVNIPKCKPILGNFGSMQNI
jgi:hypothetical protein